MTHTNESPGFPGRFRELLEGLTDELAWIGCAPLVSARLKEEMQSPKGFIRRIKLLCEEDRRSKIERLSSVLRDSGLGGLDERVDALATGFRDANDEATVRLQYNIFSLLVGADLADFPFLDAVRDFLSRDGSDAARFRLFSALMGVAGQSLSQGNKSNAGAAGEALVRAALSAVGLKTGVHYREQYESMAGSDTDFVFPCIANRSDHEIEVAVAVQMSSNDRLRLTSSELKPGAIGYVFTGNGLAASSKNLRDIGSQIINKALVTNTRMVCFGPEIEREKERIRSALAVREDGELRQRLKYFETSVISIAKFVEKMSRYSTVGK